MVRLTRIYTRTGDDGTTGLGDASRVLKTDVRVEAYGDVDEANAAIGVCVVAAAAHPGEPPDLPGRIADLLRSIQHDLFDVGADLCRPVASGEAPGSCLRITAGQTARLERAIDEYNSKLQPLSSFVLPGGAALSASLHVARTAVRRAERRVAALLEAQPAATSREALKYLNRLSDLLFVLARVANAWGKADVLWVPGSSRGG